MSKNLNRQRLDSTHDEKIFSIPDAGYESEGGNDSAEDKVFDVELHSCIPKWDTEEKILDDENKILTEADAFLFSDDEDFTDIVSIASDSLEEDDVETDIIDLEEHFQK